MNDIYFSNITETLNSDNLLICNTVIERKEWNDLMFSSKINRFN